MDGYGVIRMGRPAALARPAADDPGPVEQFVTLRAGRVEVGFRWPDDGSTGHLAYFDPLAFKNPAKKCLWRSLWYFALG